MKRHIIKILCCVALLVAVLSVTALTCFVYTDNTVDFQGIFPINISMQINNVNDNTVERDVIPLNLYDYGSDLRSTVYRVVDYYEVSDAVYLEYSFQYDTNEHEDFFVVVPDIVYRHYDNTLDPIFTIYGACSFSVDYYIYYASGGTAETGTVNVSQSGNGVWTPTHLFNDVADNSREYFAYLDLSTIEVTSNVQSFSVEVPYYKTPVDSALLPVYPLNTSNNIVNPSATTCKNCVATAKKLVTN